MLAGLAKVRVASNQTPSPRIQGSSLTAACIESAGLQAAVELSPDRRAGGLKPFAHMPTPAQTFLLGNLRDLAPKGNRLQMHLQLQRWAQKLGSVYRQAALVLPSASSLSATAPSIERSGPVSYGVRMWFRYNVMGKWKVVVTVRPLHL